MVVQRFTAVVILEEGIAGMHAHRPRPAPRLGLSGMTSDLRNRLLLLLVLAAVRAGRGRRVGSITARPTTLPAGIDQRLLPAPSAGRLGGGTLHP